MENNKEMKVKTCKECGDLNFKINYFYTHLKSKKHIKNSNKNAVMAQIIEENNDDKIKNLNEKINNIVELCNNIKEYINNNKNIKI